MVHLSHWRARRAPRRIKLRRTRRICLTARPSPPYCRRRPIRSRASSSHTVPVPACATPSWRRSRTVWHGAASRCCAISLLHGGGIEATRPPLPRPCRRASRSGDRGRPRRAFAAVCGWQVVRRTHDLAGTIGGTPCLGFAAWSASGFRCTRLAGHRSTGRITSMRCASQNCLCRAPGTRWPK